MHLGHQAALGKYDMKRRPQRREQCFHPVQTMHTCLEVCIVRAARRAHQVRAFRSCHAQPILARKCLGPWTTPPNPHLHSQVLQLPYLPHHALHKSSPLSAKPDSSQIHDSSISRCISDPQGRQVFRLWRGGTSKKWGFLFSTPASPTGCIAAMAAGRALPVARQILTPAFSAACRACTEEGSTLLCPFSSVPGFSSKTQILRTCTAP